MNEQEVISKLQNIFNEVFISKVVVSRTLSASDVEEWDSLSHISIVVMVEKLFNIKFGVGSVENCKNIGDFIDLIISSK